MIEFILKWRPYQGTVEIYPDPDEIQRWKEDIVHARPDLDAQKLLSKYESLTNPLLRRVCDECKLKTKFRNIGDFSASTNLCSGFFNTFYEPKAIWRKSKTTKLCRDEIKILMEKSSCKPTILNVEI